ncbi:MAG: 3-oxoacyl-ACP synthase, partial [Spirochaetales bacterium]|nr:3-oxoacyl-ACP synthase [Spirochaetales bacterium]
MKSRVYLSAPGLVCCAGSGRDRFLEATREGSQSGILPLTLEKGERFLAGIVPDGVLSPTDDPFDMKILRLADCALRQTSDDTRAALAAYGPERIGVCVGSCDNGTERYIPAHKAYFLHGAFPEDYNIRVQAASYPADFICRRLGVSGPAFTVSTACASSAGAVVQAAELIRAGLCDAVIAGGVDVASEAVLLGFDSLEAVSKDVCNPFSKNRRGITLGDGAAFFVMSREDLSGGGIELLGTGESVDAFHMTAPRADGGGAILAMKAALSLADIQPQDVGYINLHGTGTPLNDSMESRAVARIFSPQNSPASSSKPITGHTLGAAGALELALCWTLLSSADGHTALPVHCW